MYFVTEIYGVKNVMHNPHNVWQTRHHTTKPGATMSPNCHIMVLTHVTVVRSQNVHSGPDL